jgi:hypothetical protein
MSSSIEPPASGRNLSEVMAPVRKRLCHRYRRDEAAVRRRRASKDPTVVAHHVTQTRNPHSRTALIEPEWMIIKLWQIDLLIERGKSEAEALQIMGITSHTYRIWRSDLKNAQVNPNDMLPLLQLDNIELRTIVTTLALEIAMLREQQLQTNNNSVD